MLLRYNTYIVYTDVRIAVFTGHASVPYKECKATDHVSRELVVGVGSVWGVVEVR